MAEEFQKETRGSVRVTVGISGTGGEFKKFCRAGPMCRMRQCRILKAKWKPVERLASNIMNCPAWTLKSMRNA
jgi:hypothetical protein